MLEVNHSFKNKKRFIPQTNVSYIVHTVVSQYFLWGNLEVATGEFCHLGLLPPRNLPL